MSGDLVPLQARVFWCRMNTVPEGTPVSHSQPTPHLHAGLMNAVAARLTASRSGYLRYLWGQELWQSAFVIRSGNVRLSR